MEHSPVTLTGRHLIAGEWIASEGERVRAVDPATGAALEPAFYQAGEREVEAAFVAAVAAFEQTRDLAPERRAELLEAIADQIMALGDALLTTAQRESALPLARLTGERGRTTGQLRLFAALLREGSWVDAVIDTADPQREPVPKPDIRRMLRPLGPVVVFGASNFPFAFSACGGDTASALAAGCPVIVKGHPGHPATSEYFAHAVLAALRSLDLPAGLFSLLQGAGTQLGADLVRHPAATAVGFTGSQVAGRTLFDLAAARPNPIPVYAEMGSVNPLVLLPAALTERGEAIADGLAQSVLMGAGQMCTKPGLVFGIAGPDMERFTARLTERIGASGPLTLLNAGVRHKFAASIEAIQGAPELTTLIEGTCSGTADCSPSLFLVDAAVWRANPTLHEEAFGPAAMLIRCADEAELLAAVADVEGQLTGTVHAGQAEKPALVAQVVGLLEERAGRVIFNGYPTGVEVCHAMVHGGPYPATTAPATTSVGQSAIRRFTRPIAYQNLPDSLLPPALQNANPLGIERKVNGKTQTTGID